MRFKTKNFDLAVYAAGDQAATRHVMVLPGKLDTKDYPSMRSIVDYMAEMGYFAYSFDPPGTWESGGDISYYSITSYVAAANEVIEYLGSKRTFVIGHSMGGIVATLVATENPAVVVQAVIMSPLQLTKDDSGLPKKSLRDLPAAHGPQKEFILPASFATDASTYDLTTIIDKNRKPKLFIYGEKDTRITPSQVREFYSLASQPKLLVGVDSPHDYRNFPAAIRQIEAIVGDFARQYFAS